MYAYSKGATRLASLDRMLGEAYDRKAIKAPHTKMPQFVRRLAFHVHGRKIKASPAFCVAKSWGSKGSIKMMNARVKPTKRYEAQMLCICHGHGAGYLHHHARH